MAERNCYIAITHLAIHCRLTARGDQRRVWIGQGAIILGGVMIGDGAIVGAGSVVTNDIDEGATGG